MKKSKFLAVILAIVMMLTMSIGTAADTFEDDYGDICFESFEDLKLLAAEEYTALTTVYYAGEEPLVIEEDLTLPGELCVNADGYEVAIPEGVTLSATSEDFDNYFYAGKLTVEGTLVSDFLVVSQELSVSGIVFNNNTVYLDSFSVEPVTVTGGANVVNTQDSCTVYCFYYIESEADLALAINEASNNDDAAWYYLVYTAYSDIEITGSIDIPENLFLSIGYWDESISFTIGESADVTLNGYIETYSPITVEGALINNGIIDIYYDWYGELVVADGGEYTENGIIVVTSEVLEEPSAALSGIETDEYDIITDDEYGTYWIMHIHRYDSEVTEPTCGEEGYTTYTCRICETSYQLDYTAATGEHTYTDDSDTTCDVCGYEREIEDDEPVRVRSVPMYRMYDPNCGEHFYTGSTEERDILVEAGWNYEGVGFNFPVVGKPVYRLYEPSTGEHLYTMSETEKDTLLAAGWNYEGVAFNSAGEDEVPQYRLHNPNVSRGAYHFTGSTEERDYLISLGWEYQGIGWYSCLK